MGTVVEESHRSVYKAGGVSLLAAGVLFIAYAGIMIYIGPAPTDFKPAFLNFLSLNSLGETIAQAIWTAGFIMMIPSLSALYFSLRKASFARAIIGTGIGLTGVFVFLANTGQYFWLILNAINFETQCVNICQQLNSTAAFAADAVTLSFVMVEILIAIAVFLLAWAMWTVPIFGRNLSYLGMFSSFYSVLANLAVFFALSNYSINYMLSSYPASISLALYGLWFGLVASKLYRLS